MNATKHQVKIVTGPLDMVIIYHVRYGDDSTKRYYSVETMDEVKEFFSFQAAVAFAEKTAGTKI